MEVLSLRKNTKKKSYIQKIIFGSPGTGKSHLIKSEIIPNELGIDENKNPENIIKSVFHPEYTYGDFMGKLLPTTTKDGEVQYHFYEGHFLKCLAQAYRNILKSYSKDGEKQSEVENVALVIDEINRGNSSAIFGSVFQLLDRDDEGWSSYDITINGIMFSKFLELIGIEYDYDAKQEVKKVTMFGFSGKSLKELNEKIKFLNFDLANRTIKIPPNLSIIATMNTSDSSIYYMDTAFKRRWEWQFIDVDSNLIHEDGIAFSSDSEWSSFVNKLNNFIKSKHNYIRGVEDKQIGKYFIKLIDNKISYSAIQSKLMFFIWDSVFSRDKKPLFELLNLESQDLVTFGDFASKVKEFVSAIQDL